MEQNRAVQTNLFRIVEPVCNDAGYEVVDLRLLRDQGGWVLRVFIDRLEQPGPVGFADCERVSRELSAVLDVEDPIGGPYRLEVSSPGVDRPLRTEEHFRRHLDQEVKIKLAVAIGGRRNFHGKLLAVDCDAVTVEVDGTAQRLPLREIARANLVPNWGALFSGSRGGR